MPRNVIRGSVDHATLAAWVDHMKGVYQRAIDDYAADGSIGGRELHKIRNHLKALASIQQLISEHHEFASGRAFDAGDVGLGFRSEAVLIKPNGEVIPLKRPPVGGGVGTTFPQARGNATGFRAPRRLP